MRYSDGDEEDLYQDELAPLVVEMPRKCKRETKKQSQKGAVEMLRKCKRETKKQSKKGIALCCAAIACALHVLSCCVI